MTTPKKKQATANLITVLQEFAMQSSCKGMRWLQRHTNQQTVVAPLPYYGDRSLIERRLAEAVRFELTDDSRHRRFSRPVP
jgi:hypothetical protein